MECDSEKIISAVQKRPAIYNFHLKEHGDKKVLNKLWTEISDELKYSATDCKNKWLNLRNSYARCLRKREQKTKFHSRKRKLWYLGNSMSFLHDFINRKSNCTTDIDDIATSNDIEGTEDTANTSSVCDESIESFKSDNDDSIIPSTTQKKNHFAIQTEEPIIGFCRPAAKSDNEDNTHLLFLKSLIADINKLNEPNLRKFKRNVITTLYDLLDVQDNDHCQHIQHENRLQNQTNKERYNFFQHPPIEIYDNVGIKPDPLSHIDAAN